jgi:hypothetical protein
VGFDLGVGAFLAAKRFAVDETTQGEANYFIEDVVHVGKLAIPRKIRFHTGGGPMPRLTLGIELRNETPTCTYLEIAADVDSEVRVTHLKKIPVERWVKQIVGECSTDLVESSPTGRMFVERAATPERLKAVERMQRRRRDPRQDRALLERVAALYRQHPQAPNKAVAAEFRVSERTAGRWAEYCSDAGLLPKAPKQGQKRI